MSRATADALAAWIPRFEGRRVAVVGDPVLDVYLYGTTHRISREAPVLIVREDGREVRLGGAANTAQNLAALGAQVSLVSLVGDDDDGRRLVEVARAKGIDTTHVLSLTAGCTVTKTRVLAGGLHTRKQQMLRIDRENEAEAAPDDELALAEAALDVITRVDALVVSDYGNGARTPLYARIAREAKKLGRIVVVDSRRALASYAGVTAVTPNEPEAEAALGVQLRTGQDAARAARRLTDELGVDATILTRGREGMAIAERGHEPVLIDAHGGHEAVDVTGAGDTVVATFTLALAAGAGIVDAAALANVAASVVVKSVGAATCSPAELDAALKEW